MQEIEKLIRSAGFVTRVGLDREEGRFHDWRTLFIDSVNTATSYHKPSFHPGVYR